tara:strand:+ start:274 stop:534 length:261 start_codon:yes stop_codon:yes gene_type:complete
MAKISTYENASAPNLSRDKVIGTEVGDTTTNATKNFKLEQLVTLFNGGTTPTSDTIGVKGEIRVDDNYLYIYTGTAWKRVALSPLV